MKYAIDNRHQSWADTAQDDISVLSRIMDLPELQYQDIGQQQQLMAINERWPLLAEFCLAQRDHR
ncbi:MAG: cellulose biosynthesis protein BcsR [Oceanisphaera sp.]|uniref:cellulose biosynthesis protein BcsR n=1 Tax=Oceanisphaera sp. TaxID=1929979 RepID=UPI003C753E79